MTDLADRIEAATEGSRELDAEIAGLILPDLPSGWLTHPQKFLLHYTTSVDDALAIVPKGWSISRIWEAFKPEDRPWFGAEARRDEPYTIVKSLGAKTRAMAISAASLRAIAMEDG